MKILTISSNHPPEHFGGYELRVKEIMDWLAKCGHHIHLLTNQLENRTTITTSTSSYPVIRRLHNRHRARFFPKEILFDLLDNSLLAREIKHFKPDLIYLGHTYILSKAILPYFARHNLPIVYDEGGAGLVEAWTEHGRWFRFTGDYTTGISLLDALKKPVIWLVGVISKGRIKPQWQWPQNMQIIFNSELNRSVAVKAGVPVERSTVIHSAVDTALFSFKPRTALSTPLRILTPGRIERRKGQKDAVELLHALLKAGVDARLVLAGASWSDGYYEEVIRLVQALGLGDKVEILPMLSSAELVEQYHNADMCYFPSYHRTGFSRVPLEAMSCGCLVITYGNEGSDEIVMNQVNGYIFQPGDLNQISRFIREKLTNTETFFQLVNQARNIIENQYALSIYTNKVEQVLGRIIN